MLSFRLKHKELLCSGIEFDQVKDGIMKKAKVFTASLYITLNIGTDQEEASLSFCWQTLL